MSTTVLTTAFIMFLTEGFHVNAEMDETKPIVFGCAKNLGINDSMRMEFLNFHNNMRVSIARGLYLTRTHGSLGPAKNMYKLQWNCNLEQIAKGSIASCSTTVSTNISRNVIKLLGGKPKVENRRIFVNLFVALSEWMDEIQNYSLGANNTVIDSHLSEWAKMVYSKTTKLGCSYKFCGADFITACVYNADGSRIGSSLWEKAASKCKSSRDCTTYKDSICEDDLCVDTRNSSVAEPFQTTTGIPYQPSTSEPLKPTIDKCKLNNGMTEEVRNAFLNEHNRLRSLTARGLAENPNGTNGYAPKAARMLKMVYECKVEETASKHAQKCEFKHSGDRGVGENIWMIAARRENFKQMAISASQSWFSELKKAGVPPDNRLTMELWNRPKKVIGHYTQMVWERSYKLGCGVALCPKTTLVVCQYAPPGNMIGSTIYNVGEPCQTDSDCQCDGCKCSRNEALCVKPA